MFFNSIEFAIYLPIVFILYWFVFNRNHLLQNAFIVLASYTFYAFWDWRFLLLMAFTTVCSYYSGLYIQKSSDKPKKAKIISIMNIVVNLSILGVFKYYNFFIDNFIGIFHLFGKELSLHSLQIILPVGISFYTFQALSYSIDIYRHKIKPTNNLVSYFAYVSFFPQLVAGPIERATNLLPQFSKARKFEYDKAIDGMRQILWGLFKKVVIADNCAIYVNQVFENYTDFSGSTLLIAAVFFAFQIYGDFSGYSDIAIGTARLFGINLMRNFNYPYFSRDIAEFWRKWHISLSTWFRDYVYIPLGGSKVSKINIVRNTLIIFIVSGFWHGANWTFIVWGFLNALYFMPLILFKTNRNNIEIVAKGQMLPNIKDVLSISVTFCLTVFAWIFFRSDTVTSALGFISEIFSVSFFTLPSVSGSLSLKILLIIFILIEWFGREKQYAIANLEHKWSKPWRWVFYIVITFSVFYFTAGQQQFIYFQF